MQLTPLAPMDYELWRHRTRERLIALHQDSGLRPGHDAVEHADQYFDELLPDGIDTENARLLRIVDDAEGELGTVWLGISPTRLFIVDLTLTRVPSEAQNDELFRALLEIADEVGVSSMTMAVFSQDAEGHRFVAGRGFEVASVQMLLDPLPERPVAEHVRVQPMTPERFERFGASTQAAFAHDLVQSGRYGHEDAREESARQFARELPQGLATPGQALFTATADGEEVGILWIGMREREGRPHAFVLDVEVSPDHRRRGFGRELMHAAEQEARARGADSIGLHVFGFNTGAAAMYEQLGYRRVEELFLYER
ncbi:N-acetyltransferase family protein [Microbacterium sp. 179-I 3D4 NHS]|uniref:GNAT family N-acetyltransferase n=1 Tax=Microbacterium sp. 179-I 3D4 NHS TaxID=3142381 RepID=UPI0039A066AD